MQDRVPLYPGRVKMTPVSGQENTYDMVRADEPTQEGDPLNKSTLLKDATAELFGLPNTAVPDDVLSLLSRFHNGLGNEYVWEKTKVESDKTVSYGYVNSPDPNAYPIDDGYTYTALGQLGNKVQIATGSYVGTGKFGSSNPNSLTFDFNPKIVFVQCFPKTTNAGGYTFVSAQNTAILYTYENYEVYKMGETGYNPPVLKSGASVTNGVLTWFDASSADNQYNTSGVTYHYFAIG